MKLFLIIALNGAASFFLAQTWQNLFFPWTLSRLSYEKHSLKSFKEGAVAPGVKEFLQEPQALAGNVLNLGSWFGHQGIFFSTPALNHEVSLKTKISAGGYLDIRLGQAALRLSTTPRFNSPLPLLTENKWHQLKLLREGSENFIFIDDRPYPLPTSFLQGQKELGLISGPEKTWVDDLHLGPDWKENFSPQWGPLYGLILCLFLLSSGACLLFWTHQRKSCALKASTLLVFFSLLLGASSEFLVNRTYPRLAGAQLTQEFLLNQQKILEEKKNALIVARTQGKKIVLLLGKSQLALMGEKYFAHPDYALVNLAFMGATHPDEGALLSQLPVIPDLIVASYTQQHLQEAQYLAIFSRLQSYAQKNSLPLVLLTHPQDSAHPSEQQLLRRFAQTRGIVLWDAYNFLEAKRELGSLWWDQYHLTDLGQRLYAEFITHNVSSFIYGQEQKSQSKNVGFAQKN